jgi:hypothetical protein
MKTSSAKNKGRLHQQHCAKVVTEELKLEEGDVESRPMGSSGPDLMLSPEARRAFPFNVECKNTRTFPSLAALRQATENNWGGLPAVCWKPPGKGEEESIIYFNYRDFVKMWAGRF